MRKNSQDSEGFGFRWEVPESGFAWVEEEKTIGRSPLPPYPFSPPFLVTKVSKSPIRGYFPMNRENPLFLKFARLEGTREAILAFANKYGRLLDDNDLLPLFNREDELFTSSEYKMGESYRLWTGEISDMNWLVYLWQMLEKKKYGRLGKFICWADNGKSVSFQKNKGEGESPHTNLMWIQSLVNEGSPLLKHWPYRSIKEPIKYFLLLNLNKKVRRCVSPSATLTPTGGFNVHYEPHNLLGVLWLDFFQTFIGQRRYLPCAICGELMNVTENRISKRMHSTCRKTANQATWRRNKKNREGVAGQSSTDLKQKKGGSKKKVYTGKKSKGGHYGTKKR